ncbi:uncharacterized protein LOC119559447 isoform X2 [Drosophila subpulchrella]|uniref:uncharacterized protein LOC119559447 isoform X2 n=1 Tax=Drosophila subpulchrella TaxID=1486046 RepID=UPI0018A15130|nr:uncharacterized protein LOC119559447 isoform X2 [Drosophila subpulchrella]
MNIFSAPNTKKLNLQNTCSSYYDFLTCEHTCLDSLRCSTLHNDAPAQQKLREPPGIARRGLKYFDVDDKAAEWYLDTRRSTAERKPCKRKFCFRFRVPVRHAVRRKDKASTYSLPGRRVSPEFLGLLKQHHARMRGLEQPPRKYLSRKPSFSYYKYDAAAKRRHMRPGIDTAAPVEFPCTNLTCTRHHEQLCPCPQKSEIKTNKKRLFLFAKDKNLSEKKSNQVVSAKRVDDEAMDEGNLQPKESQLEGTKLHRIYASNPSLVTPMEIQDQPKPLSSKSLNSFDVSCPPKPILSRPHSTHATPMEKINNCPCPVDQLKWLPRPCDQSTCPCKTARFRRSRDPRSIEYENRPFFKAIQGTSKVSGTQNRSITQRRCTQTKTTSDNRTHPTDLREKDWNNRTGQDHCKIKGFETKAPENSFYASISSHQQHSEECLHRPDFYGVNDIEISPNCREGSIGYKGFVRRSEKQKIIDRCGGPIPKCTKVKPPPYCYLWSAVDPDIREAEKRRLAEHKCYQRQMFPDSKPYSYYWSKTNQDIRRQVKRRLKKTDSKRNCGVLQPNNFCRSCPDRNQETCSCTASIITQFVEKSSWDLDDHHPYLSCLHGRKPKSYVPGHTWNRKQATSDESSPAWEEKGHSPNESHRKWSGLVSTKLHTDSDRRTPKKPRLLPRLHAFAKRFLFSGTKGLHLKSNQSGSERPTHSTRSRYSSAGGSKERESYKINHQEDKQIELCNDTSSVDRKITFRDQVRTQHMQGPRDPKLWAKQSQKVFRQPKTKKNSPETHLNRPTETSFTSKVRSGFHSNSGLEQPSCSTRSSKFRNYQTSQPQKSPICIRSPSCGSSSNWSSPSSDHCVARHPPQQSPCQAPQPLVSRAQREWEERLERKRARRLREECRPCTDYLLTSRATEPRNPDIRRGVVTYRNYEFLTEPSDPCLTKPTGKCFQFTQNSPVLRNKNHYSRSRRRRRSAQCCDDSDASTHSQSSRSSGRMRGGLEFREEVLASRRHRYTAHTFPTSLPCKLYTKKRVQSIKPSNTPMHLFSFD